MRCGGDEAAAGARAAADEALTYGEGNSVEAALAAEAEGKRAREDELKALLAEQQRLSSLVVATGSGEAAG